MRNTCFIKGEIFDGSIEPAASIISGCQSGDTLEILIDSPGGEIKAAFDIVREIKDARERGVHVICKSFRECCSAAVMILLAGDERIIDEDTFILIHQPLVQGMMNATEMAEQIKSLDSYEKSMAEYYANRTQLSVENAIALMRANAPVAAADLLAAGFVTRVLPLNHDNNGGVLNISNSIIKTNKMNIFKKVKAAAIPGGVVKKNISYYTVDGKELVFENVNEGEEFRVDESRATVDGKPAEGKYVLKRGNVELRFENGLLKEITRPDENERIEIDEKIEALAYGMYETLGKLETALEKINAFDSRITTISENLTPKGVATSSGNSDDIYTALMGKGGRNGK